jgi:hypothetical protein
MLAHPLQRACTTRVNGLIASVGNSSRRYFAPIHGNNSFTRGSPGTHAQLSRTYLHDHPYSLVVANAKRPFTTSVPLSKKKEKSGKRSNDADVASTVSKTNTPPGDPFDLSQLHIGIADALTRFKDDLSKLRSGGRLNPEVIENLRLHLVKGSKETAKLGELAQVVPKGGRTIAIIVGEEDVSLNHHRFSQHPVGPLNWSL